MVTQKTGWKLMRIIDQQRNNRRMGITVTLDNHTYQSVHDKAKAAGKSMSEIISWACQQTLSKEHTYCREMERSCRQQIIRLKEEAERWKAMKDGAK